MCFTEIPNRASDAGPEETRPRDWYEWCEAAHEAITDLQRTPNGKAMLRLLDSAEYALQRVRDTLPPSVSAATSPASSPDDSKRSGTEHE